MLPPPDSVAEFSWMAIPRRSLRSPSPSGVRQWGPREGQLSRMGTEGPHPGICLFSTAKKQTSIVDAKPDAQPADPRMHVAFCGKCVASMSLSLVQ